MAEEPITRDIARDVRKDELTDRVQSTTLGEVITGRSAGYEQADLMSRTLAEEAPMRLRAITERESTNVEDRRPGRFAEPALAGV